MSEITLFVKHNWGDFSLSSSYVVIRKELYQTIIHDKDIECVIKYIYVLYNQKMTDLPGSVNTHN